MTGQFDNVLAGKNILLTGASGFLGRHVKEALDSFSPQRVFCPSSREFDLREQNNVRKLFKSLDVSVVIHLAAVVGGIVANARYPGRFFHDNALMGLLLMEEARKANVEKYVSVGTICSYPRDCPVPFRESAIWSGYPDESNAAYGLAKKMQLVQSQAYRKEYGFRAIHLLPTNLYGPFDSFDLETSHVIPALIRKITHARETRADVVEVWGSGTATREFLYVQDAAEAIAMATARYDGPLPVNIGSGEEVSIAALAELLCKLCDFTGKLRFDDRRPDGQPRRCLDVTQAKECFGFTARTTLSEGLKATIAWYVEQQNSRGSI